MQCEPSISRIKRSTNGEMALTSLAIHASTSSRLPVADVLAKFARKSERPFSTSIRAMKNPRLQPLAKHSPDRTECKRQDPLRYRTARYHCYHLPLQLR